MNKEFQRSNSLPILSRSVFIENRELDNIQIIISSDHTTSLSRHEKTPIVPGQAVASQQDDNIRVNGMTTQEDSQRRIEREERQKMILLIEKLWCEVRQLENKKMMDMISKPSAVLFDAVILGNFEVLNEILSLNPELLLKKDPNNGQTLLHVAVLYKNLFAFEIILKMQTMNLIIGEVDNDGNNIMHSAMLQEHVSYFRLQIEKLVKERVSNSLYKQLMFMRNNDGKTPCDLLSVIERKEYDEAKEEAKGKANSGMVVATLISTIVFAASLTVPGDNKNNVWFVVFILTNAVALFTSSSAIIFFFSVFTYTRNYHHEPRRVVARRIYNGFILLFISIINMVIAFVAASILIFDHHHKYKWVAFVVASLGLLPIFSFLELHFNISTLISLLTFLIFAVIIFKLYGLLALVYI